MGGLHPPGQGAPHAGGAVSQPPWVPQPRVGSTTPTVWELTFPAAGRAGKGLPGPPQGQDGSLDHPRAEQLRGSRDQGAAPPPPPPPAACRRAWQLLRERQSGMTGGQAFLSFWNNFQTLSSTAYTQEKDQSSKSHCAAQRRAPPPPPHIPSLRPRLPVPGDSDTAGASRTLSLTPSPPVWSAQGSREDSSVAQPHPHQEPAPAATTAPRRGPRP